MAEFNQEQAIKDYTELSRRIRVGAYTERSAEDYEHGIYPEDGVEESIDNLTELAAQHGLEFSWTEESGYTLIPMSEETRAARRAAEYNRAIDERNAINLANREKPWLPLHDGE